MWTLGGALAARTLGGTVEEWSLEVAVKEQALEGALGAQARHSTFEDLDHLIVLRLLLLE